MTELRRFQATDALLFLLVLAVAAGVRVGYVLCCTDAAHPSGWLLVQDPPRIIPGSPPESELDAFVRNIREGKGLTAQAPLSEREEPTAHASPAFPYIVALAARFVEAPSLPRVIAWLNCALGAVTAGLYFLFARRAFRSVTVAALAGLGCALHPFWVLNTPALNDGPLASFLLALSLVLGARAVQTAGPLESLGFGLALAVLALTRAACLPFAFVALAWFLYRSRKLPKGWLCALLGVLGFVNGLLPWSVRNWQLYQEPVPVVNSASYHLWVGNNPQATGGPARKEMLDQVEGELKSLPAPDRERRLGQLTRDNIAADPPAAVRRRIAAGLDFVFGERWFQSQELAIRLPDPPPAAEGEEPPPKMPDWLANASPGALPATVLGLLLLAFLGWRWSFAWRVESQPAALALLWVPVPYLLSHAEALSGPRLPLDGVLLCLAAYAVCCLIPGLARRVSGQEQAVVQ